MTDRDTDILRRAIIAAGGDHDRRYVERGEWDRGYTARIVMEALRLDRAERNDL